LTSCELGLFKEGFGLVLDFDVLLSVIDVRESCMLMRMEPVE
jgi:hypothetical protein